MVWAYIAVVNACLQLLISVAMGLAAAVKLVTPNSFLNLQRKAMQNFTSFFGNTRARADWGLVAKHSGLVGAWRLGGAQRTTMSRFMTWRGGLLAGLRLLRSSCSSAERFSHPSSHTTLLSQPVCL